jgi:hypothetical protein
MTWTRLLANKEVQKHRTSKNELDNIRTLITRDLEDAAVKGLSADRRLCRKVSGSLAADQLYRIERFGAASDFGPTLVQPQRPRHRYQRLRPALNGAIDASRTPCFDEKW